MIIHAYLGIDGMDLKDAQPTYTLSFKSDSISYTIHGLKGEEIKELIEDIEHQLTSVEDSLKPKDLEYLRKKEIHKIEIENAQMKSMVKHFENILKENEKEETEK